MSVRKAQGLVTAVTFFVPGPSVSKGSVAAWRHPSSGKIVRRDTNADKFKSWAQRVAGYALEQGVRFGAEPVSVTCVFRLPRPRSHFGKRGLLLPSARPYPCVKPDVDKLLRAAFDALTGIVVDDDAQIVAASAMKLYAEPSYPVGTTFTVALLSSP